MSDDPNKGVIRLQIENASEFKDDSGEESIGNNEWNLNVNKILGANGEESLGISLNCNRYMCSNVWSCNASIRLSLVKFNSDENDNSYSMEFTKKFTRNDDEIEISNFKMWAEFMDQKNHFVVGNTAVVEVSIVVNNSTGWNKTVLETFEEPDENLTDVVLVVEGKKCHVGKQILAANSKYFRVLFYSDFKESKEAEISIEDVVHSEFVDLLNCIYPSHFEITAENVDHILKLADRFEIWSVIEKAEQFLGETPEIHVVDKLKYAETFKLAELQDQYCDGFGSTQEIVKLTEHERYKELGDVTLSLLFQKLAQLEKKSHK